MTPHTNAASAGSSKGHGKGHALMLVALVIAFALLAPAPASAAFTRPFLRQITGTSSGAFKAPGGLATDTADNLWVSDPGGSPPWKLDQFEYPSDVFLKTLEIEGLEPPPPPRGLTAPQSLAIDNSTGSFYTTGNTGDVEIFASTGAYLKRFGPIGGEDQVAVDNSTGPSTGSIYVTHNNDYAEEETPLPKGIEKFNAEGVPKSFEGCGAECSGYVSGNEITGDPSASFSNALNVPSSIAVDSHGDIYTVGQQALKPGQSDVKVVDEYEPSGRFLRTFDGGETPGIGESREQGGFGGFPVGIAIDAVSGHLLVAVRNGDHEGEAAIDEFETGGQHRYVAQITKTSVGEPFHQLAEITADSKGDVYAVGYTANPAISAIAVDAWGPGRYEPSLKLAEATERKEHTATVSGSVDSEELPLGACDFQYVTEAAYEATGFSDLSSGGERLCEPAAASIPADKSFHEVKAELAGLTSGATYRYRLTATSTGALGGAGTTESLVFTATHKPRVESTVADNASSTFADLHATIDPLGAATAYRFEYLTEAAYQSNGESFSGSEPATSAPLTPAGIGSGGFTGAAPASVLERIGGLESSTVYRFRVVASNEIGVAEGEADEFTTLPQVSSGLPDNRAYELLTPPDKGSSGDMFDEHPTNGEFHNHATGYPSESGNQYLLTTFSAFGPFPGSGSSAYVFSRTPAGWAYRSLASPPLGVQDINVAVFDPFDLSRVGLLDGVGSLYGAAGASPTSLLGPSGGPYTGLHADAAGHSIGGRSEEETEIVGASRDLGHVVVESKNHALAAGAESQDKGSTALYESSGGGECGAETENCTLVNVNTEGELLSRCGAVLGLGKNSLGDPFEPESPFGNGAGGTSGKTHDAVSADGSRVFFTAPDPNALNDGPGCWNGAGSDANAPQLYTRSGGVTAEVSAPAPGAPAEPTRHLAQYVGAAEDGSRVFFVSEAELTGSDAGIHDLELFEWRSEGTAGSTGPCAESSPDYDPVARGCLTRVSAGEAASPAASSGAGVFAVPQVSAEGSAVYFIANGVLASNQGAGGGYATPGSCPVTSGHGGSCNVYRYETTTATIVYVATVSAQASWGYPNGLEGAYGVGFDPNEDWYTTPDGRYLLFLNGGQIYRYQAPSAELPSGDLQCVSCAPSGVPSVSNASSEFARSALTVHGAGPVRAMSNDGSYVFFDTAQALVPQDTNGTLDVYEWHDGTVSLISSGHDSTPSYFLGASPDGSNVFFGTHAKLVPQDTDSAGDLYDARICTESNPCIQPAQGETAQCEGGSCQSPPPAPIDATPTSLTFSGPGNLTGEAPPPTVTKKNATVCRKGYVRKKVRKKETCVKKPKRKSKAKKSNHGRAK